METSCWLTLDAQRSWRYCINSEFAYLLQVHLVHISDQVVLRVSIRNIMCYLNRISVLMEISHATLALLTGLHQSQVEATMFSSQTFGK